MIEQNRISTIRSLICHRDVDMAISCLGSLVRFSGDPVQLVVHEDGSLSERDVDKLAMCLPTAKVVYRRDADELLNERLKHHRHCYRYRYQQPYALKLLDIPLMSEGDIAFSDADVLFFRPFHDVFRWPADPTAAVFMSDCMEAYSVRPWHLLGPNKIRLPSRVNVGLFLLRKPAHDLDFLDWCLGRVEFRRVRDWIEQTCWAALGRRIGCRLWDERRIAVMRRGMAYDGKVAVHFVSSMRRFLPAAVHQMENVGPTPNWLQVSTVPSEDCTALALARSQAGHACGVLKQKMLARFGRSRGD